MTFLAEPFTQGDGQMGFPQAGFADDQEVFQIMEEAKLAELSDFGLGKILVETIVPVFEIGAEAQASFGGERFGRSVLSRQRFILKNES